MKYLIAALLFIVITRVVKADKCSTVYSRSWERITCIRHKNTIVLVYSSVWVWNRTTNSGRHEEMLKMLCDKGVLLVKEIVPRQEREIIINTKCSELQGEIK